ncbi:hypothetical protein O1611_g163 [Lasiodiplodia mahajangana]|uniref:Uncharacterized protein n=1 Tax=Lasiodiplodia mahajangana TaxID=1108764 RepID=A0ACC2K1A9_9PEZI|nr:hypothetical protein O1611_g163 [Lasiodiplodia mahajangana]
MALPSAAHADAGTRMLPALVDEIAASDPNRILYSVANTNDPSAGFLDINASTFARAVNRCAWYLKEHLGPGQKFPVVTYIGPQDVVYAILVLACNKAGYAPLFNSPRNSLDIHLHLLEATDCKVFLFPPNFPLPVIQEILAARPMRTLEIPGLRHWLDDVTDVPLFPYTKSFAEAKSDPFVLLHTSGSTGLPKPITLTHGTIAPMDAFTALPSLGHQPTFPALCAGTRVYLGVPFFHSAGLCLFLPGCIFSGFTAVVGPFPPSGVVANGVHVYGNVQHSVLTPFTLIDLAKDPDQVKNLSRLKHLVFGGGLLPKELGDLLSSHTRLLNCIGSTECGVFPIQLCDPEDWAYLKVSRVLGQEYRHISGDLYEQVIVRNKSLEPYQGVFSTFPGIEEWYMKDVYQKHPYKEDVWLYKGRSDDIIVFSNGEKLNPYDMESMILENPIITGVLVTGFGRFQSSLLVETSQPPADDAQRDELIKTIWPSVQAANRECPSYARVHSNMIIFTSGDKPMLRASKGTVQRQMTIDLYKAELDALYTTGETSVIDNPYIPDPSYGAEQILEEILSTCTDISMQGLTPDTDLFDRGLDSLQVIIVARKLNNALMARGISQTMDTRTIYANPSISKLLPILSVYLDGQTSGQQAHSNEEKMQTLFANNIADLPQCEKSSQPLSSEKLVVLLTGSTGSLGSYILKSLVDNPRVSKIYCLNRPRVSQTAKATITSPRIERLETDFSQPLLGLSEDRYTALLNEVTTIIHAAWRVDFNLSIDSFQVHVGAVRKLVDLSAKSNSKASILFVSSIGTVSNWQSTEEGKGKVPEEIFTDWKVSQSIGYAESKAVAECLLDIAAKEIGIHTIVCRVGQIAGPTTVAGIWPKQEWLPSLVASSKYLGKLPESLSRAEVVDWIPVDLLGHIIVELTTTPAIPSRQAGTTVYHLTNPKSTSWRELVPTIKSQIEGTTDGKQIELVPFERWLDELSKSATTTNTGNLAQNPASKIIEYFRSLQTGAPIRLDTTNATRVSPTLRDLEAVHTGWVENWMRQWAF